MMPGRIVKSGGPELAHELEAKGYEGIRRELGLEADATAEEAEANMTGHFGRLDVEAIRQDFPILARTFDGRPLVYLDSAPRRRRSPRR